MELVKEEALYVVQHKVTEEKLLRLEKGTRILSFQAGGKKVLMLSFGITVVSMVLKSIFTGKLSMVFAALGAAMLLVFMAAAYVLIKGWSGAKRDIKAKYRENKAEYDKEWEYRFHEDCYEIIGEYERKRLEYENIGRMIDMSGMVVMLEKGDVIRTFMKDDVKKGAAAELCSFLERKSGTTMEHVSVR